MVTAGGSGHTLEILSGTYNETLNEPTGGLTFPHGTSWSAGGFNTIEAVAGATVTVRPTSPPSHVIDTTFTSTPYYLLFKGNSQNFIFDGVNTTGGASVVKIQAPFIRFSSVEIKNANSGTTTNTGQGVYLGASNIDIWDSNIHNNGPDGSVGVGYSIYGTHDNHTILRNTLHDNSGFGIQLYPAGDNSTFANNKIYNNGKISSGACNTYSGGGVGAVLIAGTNHKVYNNVLYSNCGDGLSAFHFSTNTGTVFYNNTVYGTTGKGILGNGNTIQNNISFGNGGAAIAPTDVGDTFTADHNYCDSGCTGTGTINSGTNPFTNSAGGVFTLTSAIGPGLDLSSVFTTDYTGAIRTVPWDMGAYEAVTFVPGPVTDNFDRANGALGANWSGGYLTFNDGTIVTNKVRGTALGNSMIAVYAAPVGEIQAPTVKLATVGAGLNGDGALLLRASPSPTATFYYVGASRGSSDTTYIYRCVTGSCSAVAGDPTQTWASGDYLKATISDTSGLITVYKNDVSVITYTDSTPLTGTRTGIGLYTANALGDIELDDFYVGGTPIPEITGRVIKIQSGQTLKLGQQ